MVRRASKPGFSLLELVVVVAILAMTAGVVATGVGRSAESHQRRTAVAGLLDELMRARIDAMKNARRTTVSAVLAEGELSSSWGQRERSWPLTGLEMRLDEQAAAGPAAVMFDPDGRTAQRTWSFVKQGEKSTVMEIRFDPISGSPQLIGAAALQSAAN